VVLSDVIANEAAVLKSSPRPVTFANKRNLFNLKAKMHEFLGKLVASPNEPDVTVKGGVLGQVAEQEVVMSEESVLQVDAEVDESKLLAGTEGRSALQKAMTQLLLKMKQKETRDVAQAEGKARQEEEQKKVLAELQAPSAEDAAQIIGGVENVLQQSVGGAEVAHQEAAGATPIPKLEHEQRLFVGADQQMCEQQVMQVVNSMVRSHQDERIDLEFCQDVELQVLEAKMTSEIGEAEVGCVPSDEQKCCAEVAACAQDPEVGCGPSDERKCSAEAACAQEPEVGCVLPDEQKSSAEAVASAQGPEVGCVPSEEQRCAVEAAACAQDPEVGCGPSDERKRSAEAACAQEPEVGCVLPDEQKCNAEAVASAQGPEVGCVPSEEQRCSVEAAACAQDPEVGCGPSDERKRSAEDASCAQGHLEPKKARTGEADKESDCLTRRDQRGLKKEVRKKVKEDGVEVVAKKTKAKAKAKEKAKAKAEAKVLATAAVEPSPKAKAQARPKSRAAINGGGEVVYHRMFYKKTFVGAIRVKNGSQVCSISAKSKGDERWLVVQGLINYWVGKLNKKEMTLDEVINEVKLQKVALQLAS
jgi:hypothetical protein